jgi:hypothetical protein
MAGMDECPEGGLGKMPSGPKLVFSATVVFLLPLLTGILAAYAAGRAFAAPGARAWWQVGGLVLGALIGIVVGRWLIALMGFRATDDGEETA